MTNCSADVMRWKGNMNKALKNKNKINKRFTKNNNKTCRTQTFPVPGGPKRRIPFHGDRRPVKYLDEGIGQLIVKWRFQSIIFGQFVMCS